VYWGTPAQGSNSLITGGFTNGAVPICEQPTAAVQTIDGGIAIDPTHPGFRQMTATISAISKALDLIILKRIFLTHGALEGVHFDPGVTNWNSSL